MSQAARHWINGAWVASGGLKDSVNPATYEVVGQYHDGGRAEAEQAIRAAAAAFRDSWWRHDNVRRANVLAEIADHFEARAEDVIATYKRENGKPEALQEVSRVAPAIRYWSAMARTLKGESGHPNPDAISLTMREPVSVAGVIVPWNSPILSLRSINPALAAGCTVACKMPGQTAQAGAILSEVFTAVRDLPAGVINIFNEREAEGARWLVSSPDTRAVSFTGGTRAGTEIAAEAGRLMKRCGLELGGKNAHLVFDDADFEKMLPVLRVTAMRFGGQYCQAGSRVTAQRGVADRLREALTAKLRQVKVGPASAPDTELGPLIDRESVARVDAVVRVAIDGGAEVLLRGGLVTEGPLARGAFFAPAFLAVHDHDLPIVREEIFGPVMTVETFADEAEGVRLANATHYGLSGSVWTRDMPRALRVAGALQTGMVWINDWQGALPVGGGRLEGLRSRAAERAGGAGALSEIKHVTFSTAA